MNENLIHVKIDYEESVNSKRDILSSEADLLEIVKVIKRYKQMRIEELKIKELLDKKIKETHTEIRKLERIFPRINAPKDKKEGIKRIKEGGKYHDKEIERELSDIKEKLKELGR